ncbi:NAD-dependent succinate-semialdehyde dehydrogenase [Pelagibacterium sp.]|uniref:NAD-dependent succinate-semialdehyde dehydrogenase n=1 Tax=Pelagibacterium sp. TaxID=1967288 RepID=UPI003A94AF87
MAIRRTLNDHTLLREAALIGGEWIPVISDAIEVTNPASGEVIGRVPNLGAIETKRALTIAAQAQKEWSGRSAKERSVVLRRWFELMIENQEDLGRILTLEQGKPFAEAVGEIIYGASFIEWFAEEGRRVYGDLVPSHQRDKRILVMKQPIGVVAAITPWNFPNAMITRKAGPALAAGCALVLKPASQTPLSALALGVLAQRAGLPDGLFSVVTGSAREIGAEMTANPVVRKLTFTGSTEIGTQLYEQSAPTIKKLSLELGGNAPFIVFDDADLDAAVDGVLIAKFRNNGQTCVCANRIYVQDGVYDAFATKLAAAVAALEVGDGFAEGVSLGPLIDRAAMSKVEEHVAEAVSKGARILQGGIPHALGGTFYQATVLADVTREMRIAREETFGPIAPLFHFVDEADVIAQANDTDFGLASYFFATDIARVYRVAEALEFGIVGVNTGLVSTPEAPFGGVKLSGLGREGSKYGIDEFMELKYVCLGGIA